MRFDILTLFPRIVGAGFDDSIIKRASKKGIIDIRVHNLRDFLDVTSKERVDGRPFGGGPGMVLKVEPVYRAVRKIQEDRSPAREQVRYGAGKKTEAPHENKFGTGQARSKKTRVIVFGTRGKKFDAAAAKRLARYKQLILICGHYEGIDERVIEHIADEEISIGDYILTGGELPALVLMDAVARFIPGVLGKFESLEDVKGSYPAYTRPEVFVPKGKGQKAKGKRREWKVPPVLLSGDHAKIRKWRERT